MEARVKKLENDVVELKRLIGDLRALLEKQMQNTSDLPEKRSWRHEIKPPVFDGREPDIWVFRVERYFSLNRLTETEKIETARICFEGEALVWLMFKEKNTVFSSWEQLKASTLRRFFPDQGELLRRFFSIKQTGTVSEYRSLFERLAVSVKKMDDQILTAVFVNGLDEIIRAELMVFDPRGLKDTIERALRVEVKVQKGLV